MSFSGFFTWRLAAFHIGLRDALAYRWEFLSDILGSAIVPAAIQLILWNAMFDSNSNTAISGMTYHDMIAYTLTSVLFTQIRGGNHDFDLQELIRSGGLSNYLLRPVSCVEYIYLQGVSSKLLVAGFSLLIGCIVGFYFGLSPVRMIGAMGMAILGNLIHYQVGAVLATSAFIWEEAYSVLMVKNMVVGLLSGEMLPLSLIPTQYSWIWKSTPFYIYVFGPTQYALGKWTHAEFFYHFGIGIIWVIALWGLIKMSWGLGMKRYLSLGG